MALNPLRTITTAVTHPVHTATSTAGRVTMGALSVVSSGVSFARRVTGTAIAAGSKPAPPAATRPTPPPSPAATTAPTDAPEPPDQPAEEPAEEAVEEAVEADEIRTPSGIPAADVGTNPDTTDTDLHQPGTEPLMNPATTKAVRSESETMRKAADPHKE